ncbi:MAG TPA: proton-conducting transporter membrane subunit [Myxococcales bacterium]|nr:proton-conducting transporter membrane subunit [Myxococcales bacterium]
MDLLLASLAVLALSALLAVALSPWPRWATAAGAAGALVGCALGLWPAVAALSGGESRLGWSWPAPYGELALGLDRLSAFFLVPVFGLAAVTALYGRGYLLGGKRKVGLGAAACFFNLLTASMALVVVARDAFTFLVGWELVTLTSFLLVSFEHEEAEVRRAGWVYLIAGHVGGLALMALFGVLIRQSGDISFAAFQRMPPPDALLAATVALLAAFACGMKAGFVPLHVWLPEAHAAAPSHLSAVMSGASIKVGLYGLLRLLLFLPAARWWGPSLILLGFACAAYGISQALQQRDFKRVLAYSSVENMGLILIGLGIAWWGNATGSPALAALGALAAGFHIWSHALMKGLLFLCAGSVLHGAGTRDLERMGGLARHMPATAALALFGSVAIAGLPPLNGFVSEWLLLRGLFAGSLSRLGAPGIAALLGMGALALIGALASLCFVRLAGISLLGNARTEAAARAHESGSGLLVPMALLAAGCAALSLWPSLAVAPASAFAGQLFGGAVATGVNALAPSLSTLGAASAVVVAAAAAVYALLLARVRKPSARPLTWDCGYAAPSARMQYTARSFAQLAAELLFPAALRPRTKEARPEGLFPARGLFAAEDSDPLTRRWYEPFFTRWAERFAALRWVQQGVVHAYLFYILAVVVVALGWSALQGWWVR